MRGIFGFTLHECCHQGICDSRRYIGNRRRYGWERGGDQGEGGPAGRGGASFGEGECEAERGDCAWDGRGQQRGGSGPRHAGAVCEGDHEYPDIVVGMLIIGVLGMLSSAAVRFVGERLMPWHRYTTSAR